MAKKNPSRVKSPLTVLRLTFDLFKAENQDIFYPFVLVCFVNLVVFELLYFYPRHPMAAFFQPVVSRVWGEGYMHYPMNLVLLPQLFYYAQTFIFIFISSLLIALTADIVNDINNNKKANISVSFRRCRSSYVYLVIYSLLTLLLFFAFDHAYRIFIHRAFRIQSTTGLYFWIKKAVIQGMPYAQFLYSIFATALLIYVPVVIILEKKKFFAAFLENFKVLWGSFWITVTLTLVPMLFYLPLVLVRDNIGALADMTSPEIQVVLIILGIFVVTAINMFIMASASVYYLYKKENA